MQRIILILLVLVVVLIALPPLPSKVTFKSTESTLEGDAPVFNEVWLEEKPDKDIWMMNQSHDGANYPKAQWDQVKIVVDKKTKIATFHQLKDGKDIPLKVDCNICHANGPRAITPEKVNFTDKVKIALWNIKIKSYGTLTQNLTTEHRAVHNQTCMKCHNGGSNFWERSKLSKSNFLAIKHLVKNDLMPPWPYKLSKDEKQKILNGLK